MIGCVCLFASPAFAQLPTGPDPLEHSTFQGGDGNQDAAGGHDDWDTLQAAARVVHSADDNDEDTAFAGGSEENFPVDWDFTTEAGGVSPEQANILDAWSAVDQPDGHTFLYLALTREKSAGTSYISFELNRDGRLWDNGHAKIPCRRDDDISVVVAPSGNTISLVLQQWTTAATDPATGCARTGSFRTVASFSNTNVQGAVNGAPITSRLPGFFAPGSQIGAGLFAETALNISALLEAAFEHECLSFGSVWLHSRSSLSASANLQDFVAPRPLIVRTCAASGTKFFDGNANGVRDTGEPGVPRFLIWADYDNDGVFDANEPFSVTDSDGHYVIDDIRQPYTLREQLLTRAAQTAWRCSFPNQGTPGGFADNGTGGLFRCGWNEIDPDVTPYAQGRDFGNWLPAALTVEKQLSPPTDPGRFNLIVNGLTVLPNAGNGARRTMIVRPGTFNVSEAAVPPTNPADYTSSVICQPRVSARGARRSAAEYTGLVLRAAEHATCIFTNVRHGTPAIALVKSGPAVAEAGSTLHYRLYLTNVGEIPFPEAEVSVTDEGCDSAPKRETTEDAGGPDDSPGTLNPGDTWIYTCSHKTPEPGADCEETKYTNDARAQAGAAEPRTYSITTELYCPHVPPPPTPTPTPEPGPTPEPLPGPPEPTVTPPGPEPPTAGAAGVAGITTSNRRCITRASELRFSGTRVDRLRVSVNGMVLGTRTLRLLQRRAFPLRRLFRPGRYRVSIRVTFERGSATPSLTLTRDITICGRPARAPAVTG